MRTPLRLVRCGLGAARGCRDVVSVTLGTGVGGGVILGGDCGVARMARRVRSGTRLSIRLVG